MKGKEKSEITNYMKNRKQLVIKTKGIISLALVLSFLLATIAGFMLLISHGKKSSMLHIITSFLNGCFGYDSFNLELQDVAFWTRNSF